MSKWALDIYKKCCIVSWLEMLHSELQRFGLHHIDLSCATSSCKGLVLKISKSKCVSESRMNMYLTDADLILVPFYQSEEAMYMTMQMPFNTHFHVIF